MPAGAARQRRAVVGDEPRVRLLAAVLFGLPAQVEKVWVQGFVEPRSEQELTEQHAGPEPWEAAVVWPERDRCAAAGSALALVWGLALVRVWPEPARCAAAGVGAKSELAQLPAAGGALAAPSSPAPFLFAALAAALRVQTAVLEVQVALLRAVAEVHVAAVLRAAAAVHAAEVLRTAEAHAAAVLRAVAAVRAAVVLRAAAERAALVPQVAPVWGGARSVRPWAPPSAAAWVCLPVPPWPAPRPAARSAPAKV